MPRNKRLSPKPVVEDFSAEFQEIWEDETIRPAIDLGSTGVGLHLVPSTSEPSTGGVLNHQPSIGKEDTPMHTIGVAFEQPLDGVSIFSQVTIGLSTTGLSSTGPADIDSGTTETIKYQEENKSAPALGSSKGQPSTSVPFTIGLSTTGVSSTGSSDIDSGTTETIGHQEENESAPVLGPTKGQPSTGVPLNRPPSVIAPSLGEPSFIQPSTGLGRYRNKHSRGKGRLAHYVPGMPRWYEVSAVQDALNQNELDLLKTMWTWRETKELSSSERELRAGVHTLAYLSGMHPNNVRLLLKSLVAKHAIRIQKSEQRTGTPAYTVLSWGAIVQKWKHLGLRYAVWNRGAATLVSELEAYPEEATSLVGEPKETPPSESPTTRQAATPVKGRYQLSPKYKRTSSAAAHDQPTTSQPSIGQAAASLRTLVQAVVPQFDEAAITQLVKECRNAIPEISSEDISAMFQKHLPSSRGRGIKNQVGYLLWRIVEDCTPEAVDEIRRSTAEAVPTVSREYWEQLLAHPDATEEMRRSAKEQLNVIARGTN